VREVLCGQVRASVADAGDLVSVAANRVFRGHGRGARDCLAAGGLTGAAAFRGHRARRVHAGSLDHLAHARLIDRDPHREVFRWVLGVLADRGLLKGQRIAIDATTLEANAAMRSIVRRDTGASYEEFLRGLAKASGIATPTREDLARLDHSETAVGACGRAFNLSLILRKLLGAGTPRELRNRFCRLVIGIRFAVLEPESSAATSLPPHLQVGCQMRRHIAHPAISPAL
jgi:hypothetical protein